MTFPVVSIIDAHNWPEERREGQPGLVGFLKEVHTISSVVAIASERLKQLDGVSETLYCKSIDEARQRLESKISTAFSLLTVILDRSPPPPVELLKSVIQRHYETALTSHYGTVCRSASSKNLCFCFPSAATVTRISPTCSPSSAYHTVARQLLSAIQICDAGAEEAPRIEQALMDALLTNTSPYVSLLLEGIRPWSSRVFIQAEGSHEVFSEMVKPINVVALYRSSAAIAAPLTSQEIGQDGILAKITRPADGNTEVVLTLLEEMKQHDMIRVVARDEGGSRWECAQFKFLDGWLECPLPCLAPVNLLRMRRNGNAWTMSLDPALQHLLFMRLCPARGLSSPCYFHPLEPNEPTEPTEV